MSTVPDYFNRKPTAPLISVEWLLFNDTSIDSKVCTTTRCSRFMCRMKGSKLTCEASVSVDFSALKDRFPYFWTRAPSFFFFALAPFRARPKIWKSVFLVQKAPRKRLLRRLGQTEIQHASSRDPIIFHIRSWLKRML